MTRYPSTENLDACNETILEPAEARPCPFCGVQPVIKPWHGGAPTKHMVSCADDCDEVECSASPSVVGNTRSEALARWNTRAA